MENLVEDVEQYDREKPLVVAKTTGGREMAASVQSKMRVLKVRKQKVHAPLWGWLASAQLHCILKACAPVL